MLLLLPPGPGRPPGAPEISVNRSSCFQSAARPLIRKKAPFPPGISELASQASGASLHQERFRKSRAGRGCGWFGLPPAQHIYGYVGVPGNACSCAGLEGAAQNPHKTHALTSPRLALLGPISVSTRASTCPSPLRNLGVPVFWVRVPAQTPLWPCGPDLIGVFLSNT